MAFQQDQGGTGNFAYKHGLSRHPLYGVWYLMLRRCEDPSHPQYADYGGRGITVCEEWHDVAAFVGWIEANLGPRPAGLTLDRIDNNNGYGPGKVRWATRSMQNRNQRRRPQRHYPVGRSGYYGVRPARTPPGRWRACITERGREISLGTHSSPEAAARAYDRKSVELSGNRARLNFPGEWNDFFTELGAADRSGGNGPASGQADG